MKEIRDAIEKLKNQLANLWRVRIPYPVKALEYQNQSVAEIKKIVLGMVGEDEELFSPIKTELQSHTNYFREGSNQAKAEIRKKVEGEL